MNLADKAFQQQMLNVGVSFAVNEKKTSIFR